VGVQVTSLVANTAEEKRTPTLDLPLRVGADRLKGRKIHIRDASSRLVAEMCWHNSSDENFPLGLETAEAYATRLVLACNSFDALTGANARLLAAVECADAYELRDDWREVLEKHGWNEAEHVASIFIRKLRREALASVTP
jgi:hypothetical protein